MHGGVLKGMKLLSIVLDYQLEATDGAREASRGINGPLEAAIREGGVASVDVPIAL